MARSNSQAESQEQKLHYLQNNDLLKEAGLECKLNGS